MGVLAPGVVVGGCRIEGVVGKGGMGVVYLARQLELERDVALKVIAPELTEDPIARARFLAEARAAAAVEHANVVPVHGVGTEDDRAYLVMRLIRGDDLRALVRREGPFAPIRAAAVVEQLGDALDAIHRAGYVHRDVKPPNVLLDDDGHVYLSDFGLAKAALATRGPTSEDHWVGTLDYVAPEQIRGEPVDPRTDVYALGGVLHFMLTGRPPFVRDGDEAKLWAHLHDPPPRPSEKGDAPAALDGVVVRALAKEPAARYPSAGALGRAARAAACGEDPDATTATRRAVTGASRPRARARPRVARRAGLGAMLAAVAGAGLVGAAALLDGDRARGPAGAAPGGALRGGSASGSGGATPEHTALPFRRGPTYKDIGFRPRGIALTQRAVWVISYRRERIVWLDHETGVRRRAEEIGPGATSIATDGRSVWVALALQSVVARLDARTGAVVARVPVPGRPISVAVGSTGLWVAVEDELVPGATLVHYTADGTRLESHYVEDGIAALTYGAGAVWVALANRNRIMRAVPGKLTGHATLALAANALAFGRGRLWATVGADAVARINPVSQETVAVNIDSLAEGLDVSGHHVVVALQTDSDVLILDARHWRRPGKRLAVPPNPYAVAAKGRRVWVTGVGHDTLTRLDRTPGLR
jgi:predicted Ser/Thr protein kinase